MMMMMMMMMIVMTTADEIRWRYFCWWYWKSRNGCRGEYIARKWNGADNSFG